ncbi:uncharacterized protein C8R40DRAFT_650954 [Lentinula edodes]|uniref:uncharacterized protein n=1 Tax=Lentinula edodes TaxID=5353 RepID=UPI001E8DB77F|nr:uncharacterized protein C8R40DRAFT_650954 [Lentinula edodes]KAH7870307.1 hypothetical protein C8R40DRAFT_650954 [Lentinula edodes]
MFSQNARSPRSFFVLFCLWSAVVVLSVFASPLPTGGDSNRPTGSAQVPSPPAPTLSSQNGEIIRSIRFAYRYTVGKHPVFRFTSVENVHAFYLGIGDIALSAHPPDISIGPVSKALDTPLVPTKESYTYDDLLVHYYLEDKGTLGMAKFNDEKEEDKFIQEVLKMELPPSKECDSFEFIERVMDKMAGGRHIDEQTHGNWLAIYHNMQMMGKL